MRARRSTRNNHKVNPRLRPSASAYCCTSKCTKKNKNKKMMKEHSTALLGSALLGSALFSTK